MKICRFTPGGVIPRWGVVEGETVYEVSYNHGGPLIAHDLSEINLLPPVMPGKVICVGLNYRDHAEEMRQDLPEEPVLFLKPPSAVIGPGKPVICPQTSRRVDYEAELAVVMSKTARCIPAADACRYILGYTCANDITARDLQAKDGQWTRAKSFDTFLPLGPYLVSGLDPDNLDISLYLNGERKQHSNTSRLIFTVPRLINFISSVMTLEPGDVILTGTPAGVGRLNRGDTVEVVIEGVGRLINPVK
ncbi:fumarylacetoacetate hydrolase family protein [Desulfotomaculum copahuensis]|uniref:2-hydroxyhepta-2,4-diene-1,7-dioate isomerase n=1 Tax=Desulfotomaculum copahuensis TaxID=1838280 RepID=A0A1B7LH02_9FIRM|nr:fumarylacetoacetate hydrolase family protein [Desulfotomaculum copahuensis]OAT85485.1 hypothetical protein A6M21_06100 [Desulfotomaculum copahuensis]